MDERFDILNKTDNDSEKVILYDIPFILIKEGSSFKNLANEKLGDINKTFDKLFFLGMTTFKMEGSEWWGQAERYHAHQNRLFIGDRLGKIQIIYCDKTMDVIPLIFGVNLWNFDQFTKTKEYNGPYSEPFESDINAGKLLEESLILVSNCKDKAMKYILGIDARRKKIKDIELIDDDFKAAGFYITAVTGLLPDVLKSCPPGWKTFDESYFIRQRYYPATDRLARRLYQFRDDIPSNVPLDIPEGYSGPTVVFKGNKYADIFTNVYFHNMQDMITKKVDEEGMMHTSSVDAPLFGLYVGIGTYKKNVGEGYKYIWTRDIGRVLMETIEWGDRERSVKAAEKAFNYLYDKNLYYDRPNWKRVANTYELGDQEWHEFSSVKENDGHAAMMLFIYRLVQHRCVDIEWVKNNWKYIFDAAEWFGWQIDCPEESKFDRVLHSQSEASTQTYGGYDLFSNCCAFYALKAFSNLARLADQNALAERWESLAARLWDGVMECFVTEHPRYGLIFTDTIYDVWTYEYKRFAPLFLASDLTTYDIAKDDTALYKICKNTYLAQKEDFFNYASGRQMGYGQGYISQTAILLDDYEDMKGFIEQAAAFCYHHTDYNYIVPEGVIMHPSGRFWFRNADLGNAVQQAEIVKCARLLIGLDDLNPEEGLKIIPRLPEGWESIIVEDYPVISAVQGGVERCKVNFSYKRLENGYSVDLHITKPVKINYLRVGPFPKDTKEIDIEGADLDCNIKVVGDNAFVYLNLLTNPLNYLSKKVVTSFCERRNEGFRRTSLFC